MINLNLKLKLNKHYINYGSIFSRLLLLKEELLKTDSFLIVLENDKILNSYQKILDFLSIDFKSLDNFSDLVNFSHNKR
ncbi:hypothetical protein HOB94_04565 [bacterium]|nr:hypothetical protein [bacterium]